jgi:hypothetical protein
MLSGNLLLLACDRKLQFAGLDRGQLQQILHQSLRSIHYRQEEETGATSGKAIFYGKREKLPL